MPDEYWIIEKIILIDKLLKTDEERDPPTGYGQRDERRQAEDLIYEILGKDPSNRMALDRLQEICLRELRDAIEPDDDRPWSPYYDVLVKTAMMLIEKHPSSLKEQNELLYTWFFSDVDPYLYLVEAQRDNRLETREIERLKKTLKLKYWQGKIRDTTYKEQYEIENEEYNAEDKKPNLTSAEKTLHEEPTKDTNEEVIIVETGPNVQWNQIKIFFTSEYIVQIIGPDIEETRDYHMMGFRDGRKKTYNPHPKPLWGQFRMIAELKGLLSWEDQIDVDQDRRDKVKKWVSQIGKHLKKVFPNISGRPFKPYKKNKGYQTEFILNVKYHYEK